MAALFSLFLPDSPFFFLLLLLLVVLTGVIWKQGQNISEMRRKMPSEEEKRQHEKLMRMLEDNLQRRQEQLEKLENLNNDKMRQIAEQDARLSELLNNAKEAEYRVRSAEEETYKRYDEIQHWEKEIERLQGLIVDQNYALDAIKESHKEALLRENAEKTTVWRLEFDETERIELKELNDVVVRLRNPVPLYKAIFEIYYRNKMRQLVGSLGVSSVSGIYRIWLEDGRSYVGQSVDVGERWLQHLKRAVGAEEGTSVMLYPAMRKFGIDKFAWELIERVNKDRLGEREKYWAEFYVAKETGFNIKS